MTERPMGRRVIDNFWAYVDKSKGKKACWPWTRHIDIEGYGRAVSRKNGNGIILAHRHAWTFTFGKIPNGLHVLHSCDNPACCNPAHLYLGTHQDNMNDRNRKGRFFALLTEDDVRTIRQWRAQGMQPGAIGKRFDISQSHVSHICARRIWRHIP